MSSVQPKPSVDPVRRQQLVDERFAAQRTLWQESSLSRVRHCGNSLSKRTGSGDAVQVKKSDDCVGFSGLQTCGSVHSCPVCSQKIQAGRVQEIQAAVDAWHAQGGRVVFVTLTMRHFLHQRLAHLMDAGSHAWGRVTSGRAWKEDAAEFGTWLPRVIKSGVRKGETVYDWRIHFIRLSETTRTYKNGWHNHFHTLLFVRGDVTDDSIRRLSESIYGRWADGLTSRGLSSPTPEHGIDCKLVRVKDGGKDMAGYLSKNEYVGRITNGKVGLEMAYSAGKTGKVDPGTGKIIRAGSRTPFQILADVVELGDVEDLELWHEWEQASKGRRQLTWSTGLRSLLELEPEKTDEELAEEDLQGTVVMTIPVDDWSGLRFHKGRIVQLVRDGITDLEQLKRIIYQPDRAAAA